PSSRDRSHRMNRCRPIRERSARSLALGLLVLTVDTFILSGACLATACSRGSRPSPGAARSGGHLTVSTRIEPRTYNRFASRTETDVILSLLTQATLFRINRTTDEVEPWLVEKFQKSADGLRYTLTLPPDVTFSDGRPLTADDVVFSFEAAYD